MEGRAGPSRTPGALGLEFEDVTVSAADGTMLAGWFVPTVNGAVVIAQHGYKANRDEMLNEAAMLHEHGYGVLLSTVRAHDLSAGELITFGVHEMKDLDAWFQWVAARPGVDSERIGILGNSMGGSLSLQYAAANPAIRAVVANSAFSSIEDTVETSVQFFTGLPAFPFAPMIVYWAEREADFDAGDVDVKQAIPRISPRPVFLMQGGRDIVISPDSGQRLFDAAGEPKELWFEPDVRHAEFDTTYPDEYRRRVVAFFDRYLK